MKRKTAKHKAYVTSRDLCEGRRAWGRQSRGEGFAPCVALGGIGLRCYSCGLSGSLPVRELSLIPAHCVNDR